MKKHPKAKQPVRIANGPNKGSYFVVEDYVVNQFQGKDIKRIQKSHRALIDPVELRGYPVDNEIVFGTLYPDMTKCCVHDKELQVNVDEDKTIEELEIEDKARKSSEKSGGESEKSDTGRSAGDSKGESAGRSSARKPGEKSAVASDHNTKSGGSKRSASKRSS